jgi:hypothetical protein
LLSRRHGLNRVWKNDGRIFVKIDQPGFRNRLLIDVDGRVRLSWALALVLSFQMLEECRHCHQIYAGGSTGSLSWVLDSVFLPDMVNRPSEGRRSMCMYKP